MTPIFDPDAEDNEKPFDYELRILTIYAKSRDYPDEYVARWSTVVDGATAHDSEIFARGKTLEEVRQKVPPGLYRMDRHPQDDPVIVETWL